MGNSPSAPTILARAEQKWLAAISDKRKTVSCHWATGDFKGVLAGQRIIFHDEAVKVKVETTVSAVTEHPTIEAALKVYGTSVYPGLSTEPECVAAFATTNGSGSSPIVALTLVVVSAIPSEVPAAEVKAAEIKPVVPAEVKAADVKPVVPADVKPAVPADVKPVVPAVPAPKKA